MLRNIIILLIWFVINSDAEIDSACLKCICNAASNCNSQIGCTTDLGSSSCGPYQIQEAYWIDCGKPGEDWKTCADSVSCSETCISNYMDRYGTYCTGGATPTCQDYAIIHNGGANGCKNTGTIDFWKKVDACYSE